MKAVEIINRAADDGISVRISDNGKLKAKGEDDAIGRWLPLLRQYKTEITKLLLQGQGVTVKATKPLPQFCQDNCPGLEPLTLPGEGPVLGCLDPRNPNHWTRLDRLTSCPARKPRPVLPLPEWCSTSCERYVRLDLPTGRLAWCVSGTDARHWSYTRIDAMSDCPLKGQGTR